MIVSSLKLPVPEHVKLPVAPSIVQPVAPDPPAKLIEAAVAPVGPMLIEEAAPNALTVVVLVLNRLSIPVADVPRV